MEFPKVRTCKFQGVYVIDVHKKTIIQTYITHTPSGLHRGNYPIYIHIISCPALKVYKVGCPPCQEDQQAHVRTCTFRVDIKHVYVCVPGRVLKQSVVRVEHLMGEQVEPLSSQSSIIQASLSLKLHIQSRLQYLYISNIHDVIIGVLK